ncbi:hypothetical protein L1049_014462 [Liquidambar formosana]|uniref:HhH-GPD domain-containing protein n=1 Tax=Liquidambar formosana TaxID=63359 RepID=A0AAP0S2D0_LIQFO
MEEGGGRCSCVVEMALGEAAATFDLEKAVCSHGLFMMPPNHWDPSTKTLQRPLHLHSHASSSSTTITATSLLVRISHPQNQSHSLRLLVFGTHSLSPQHRQALLGQVGRMLRLSDTDERSVREFHSICAEAKDRGFSGRLFRSPTLFEDMVKCILLCNCQWPRTLNMARALCELQLELQCHSSSLSGAEAVAADSNSAEAENEHFTPKTPAGKDPKRKLGVHDVSTSLRTKFAEAKAESEADANLRMDCVETTNSLQTQKLSPNFLSSKIEDDLYENCNSRQTSNEIYKVDLCSPFDIQFSEGREPYFHNKIGNFPTPRELASLDENFLAKRCNLGYRASRILKLAQSVVEGRIQLTQLEEVGKIASLASYDKLAEQLKEIDGFGPFTCANVLMCMGFYHVIPTDSETIRHLKQVHARKSTIQTVQGDVEKIYGKYAPFQFLAYWSELWHFYEKRFGKLSEIPHSDYKLMTASNMRTNGRGKNKRTKVS